MHFTCACARVDLQKLDGSTPQSVKIAPIFMKKKKKMKGNEKKKEKKNM